MRLVYIGSRAACTRLDKPAARRPLLIACPCRVRVCTGVSATARYVQRTQFSLVSRVQHRTLGTSRTFVSSNECHKTHCRSFPRSIRPSCSPFPSANNSLPFRSMQARTYGSTETIRTSLRRRCMVFAWRSLPPHLHHQKKRNFPLLRASCFSFLHCPCTDDHVRTHSLRPAQLMVFSYGSKFVRNSFQLATEQAAAASARNARDAQSRAHAGPYGRARHNLCGRRRSRYVADRRRHARRCVPSFKPSRVILLLSSVR